MASPEAVDVHGPAPGEVEDGFPDAGRAGRVLAPRDDLALGPEDLRAADGAALRPGERPGAAGPPLLHHRDDVGDDVPAPLDEDVVADPHVLPSQLLFVVEGRPADRRSRELDRLEHGHGRQRARAADLDDDVVDPGRRLPGRELVGDGPARRLGRRPELPPLVRGVDLDDDAVGVVIEAVPLRVPLPEVGQGVVDGRAEAGVGIGREAELAELLEGAPLAGLLPAVDDEIIKEDAEVAGGHLLGIEEPDGARRGVAGVGEEGLARFLALPVDLAEGREREVDLAADLDFAARPR